jgi:hypothetical protein
MIRPQRLSQIFKRVTHSMDAEPFLPRTPEQQSRWKLLSCPLYFEYPR